MKTAFVLLVLSAMVAPPIFGQGTKKKTVAAAKPEAGPSTKETEDFILEKLLKWGEGGRHFQRGNQDVYHIIKVEVSIQKGIINIIQTINENFSIIDEDGSYYSGNDSVYRLKIDCKEVKLDLIKAVPGYGIRFELGQGVNINYDYRKGGSTSKFKGEKAHVNQADPWDVNRPSTTYDLYLNPNAEVERLMNAIRHLCSLNGNKLKPAPF